MKFIYIVATIVFLTLTFSASAHISLKQSTPTDEAMLMQSPEQLTLLFSGEVRLAKVTINDAKNQFVDFSFTASATPSDNFSWPLPLLAKGNYTVKWIALGGDGHKMSDTFTLMRHGAELMSEVHAKQEY